MSGSNELVTKNVQNKKKTKSKSKSKSSSKSVSKSKSGSTESAETDELKHLDPDKFIEAYGTFGRYQLFTYALVQTLNFFYSASVYVMSYVQLNIKKECFYHNVTLPVTATCRVDDDKYGAVFKDQQCGHFEDSEIIHEHNSRTNLVIDFDLLCSHWVFKELGLTFFTLGAVVAVPFMSYLADRLGRRPIILASTIIAFLANVLAFFSPNYIVFLVLRTIVGAASDTYLSIASVATCEFLAEKTRPWITVVYNIAWALGMLWVLAVTFMTDSWKWRYLLSALPGVYAFILICLLPESPHWLIIHNKTERLRKYIKVSNKINNADPDFEDCHAENEHAEKHEGVSALVSSNRMLWVLFANGYIEFVISLVYFAISFLSVEYEDSHVKSFFFVASVEIPAGLVVLPLMIYFGRKSITFWSFAVQSFALIGVAFLNNKTINFICMLIAKIMATIIYSIHPIWANEQFPTSVRSLAFSFMNIPQSIGIIISPYSKHVNLNPQWLMFSILSILSFVATIFTLLLKETKNCALPIDVKSLSNSNISTVSSVSSVSRKVKLSWPDIEPATDEEMKLLKEPSGKTEKPQSVVKTRPVYQQI